jgi:hypothetical protein
MAVAACDLRETELFPLRLTNVLDLSHHLLENFAHRSMSLNEKLHMCQAINHTALRENNINVYFD